MSPSNLGSFFSSNAVYLLAWCMLLGLLTAGLAATLRCRVTWFHSWLSLGRLSDLVLSSDPSQKVLGIRFLVGWANCIVGVAALNFGASKGIVDVQGTRDLTLAAMVAQAAWYAVIRSGWNKRFDDPSLSGPMRATVIVFLAWGYVIGGPGRPVALMLLFMMLMFSMFTGTSRALIRISLLAAAAFGSAMVYIARTEAHIPNTVELQIVYFGVMLTMLISVCLLVSQLASLRERSTQRKNDLGKAMEQLRQLATRDELTGLFNRRHMVDLLQAEKLRADRTLRGFAVCVIDVDHFKAVNDQFGHGVGDEALRVLGRLLEESLRDTDAVARWGGEEFLIMFTDSNDEAPMQVLERVRQHLDGTPVSHLHARLRITFSAGLTAYRTGEDIYQVIERADQALYDAKAAGRNCTRRAASPPAAAA